MPTTFTQKQAPSNEALPADLDRTEGHISLSYTSDYGEDLKQWYVLTVQHDDLV